MEKRPFFFSAIQQPGVAGAPVTPGVRRFQREWAGPLRASLALGALAGLALGVYLLASQQTYGLGFPLDDGWIHQTYARNLAMRGEWAFLPGEPSAGSTSPLWSVMLAAGYLLRSEPRLWAYFLGWLCLWGLTVLGKRIFQKLLPERAGWAVVAGGLLAMEWHLVWAAGSGMETLLFAGFVLVALGWLVERGGELLRVANNDRRERSEERAEAVLRPKSWFFLGAVIGLSAWVRPDGLTLLGPAGLVLLGRRGDLRIKVRIVILLCLGFLTLFSPYLFFNRALAGAFWPNTFYAKQAEYALHTQLPLHERLASQASLPLVGVGVLLFPGFAWFTWRAWQERHWGRLASALWVAGYLGSYAWRLPVTYQHGRYAMPAMPVFFVLGFAGLLMLAQIGVRKASVRILSRAWLLSAGLVLLVFWARGAVAYARDVAVIESEMVAAARWVAMNSAPGQVVAAHDIGALGYFGGRRILDLAGLVSPEVIPFIRDERALAEFLNLRGADYLVTFPGWYPELTDGLEPVYNTGGTFSPSEGGENMVVYRWRPPGSSIYQKSK